MVFNVKSKTANFFPKLLVSEQAYNLGPTTIFPPNEMINFTSLDDFWDTDLYTLKASLHFKDLRERSFLAINLQYFSNAKNLLPD